MVERSTKPDSKSPQSLSQAQAEARKQAQAQKHLLPQSRNESHSAGVISQFFRSSWSRWIGMRYLRSKKSSSFLSFITLLSILGVGLGVTAMIVVLSVMDGFEAELKKRLMATELHILVSPTQQTPGFSAGSLRLSSEEAQSVMTQASKLPGVEKVRPVISTEAILRTGKRVAGVVLKGVDSEYAQHLKTLLTESARPEMLIERQNGTAVRLPGLMLGQELAFELGVIPGDLVTLVSPTETQGPMEAVPRMQRFAVEGIYHTGVADQELHVVFALDQQVRAFLRRTEVVSNWELIVKNFDQAPAIAAQLRAALPGFRVQDWVDLNSSLFFSLKLERVAMFIALAFIVVVASFNIVSTLTLMVIEKRREISILKAMGARDSQIGAIFLSEGIFIGSFGVGAGILLGGLICLVLKSSNLISLPEVYYDRTLPVTFNGLYYVLVAGISFGIVLLSAVSPSKKAARLNPLTGIRQG